MENQNVVKKGWVKASLVCAIVAMVFALLPLLSAWFMFLTALNWVIVPLSIVFGVIAIVKKQNLTKAIIAMAIAILAFLMPRILVEQYVKSAADTVSNTAGLVNDMSKSAGSDYDDYDDYEW